MSLSAPLASSRLTSWSDDPDYLKKERAELRRRPLNFDYIGLGLLVLIMSSWEIMLSKGQEWDWYNDAFWRVQTLFVIFVLGLALLFFRETRIANPVVDFRPLSGAELRGLLHHHLLCLWHPLRRQHVPSGPAPVASSATMPMSRGWCNRHRASSRLWG